ncbi:MAG: aromatic ring-hydroxylating oxygenase subunit alpha, partial [Mycobacterium sp.]
MSLIRNDGLQVNRRTFFDEANFSRETERIFRNSWQFVAHESEISQPGDYITRYLGLDPVIVVRSEKAGVRVLHNSCRHRGTELCAADIGNTSHFRCSYHGWTYANSGELRGVPRKPELYGNAFDRSQLGLKQAKVEIFCGLIFATWDEAQVPLQEALGEMAWYIESVLGRAEMEVMGPPTRILGNFNWKSGAENWSGGEGYHVQTTHKIVMDLGVAVNPEPLFAQAAERGAGQPVPDPSMEKTQVCQFATSKGHTGLALRAPVKFDRPVFLGYES